MADAFLSFVVQKLGDFLIKKVSLHKNLRDEVTWLRNEVFEINSIAIDVVAILETYSFEAGKGASHLKACACICRKEKKFYNVAEEIQSLKQRIIDISRKRETYGITNINSNSGEGPSNQVRTLRRTTSYVDDQDYIFVGLQDYLAELLKEEPRRSVLFIYGMGGLGKTTLARKLYTSPNIASSFPTRAWICVSQEYNTMDLLRTIIKSIQGRNKETLDLLERMTEGDLEIYLRDLLKERKYLVVVDDVWQREAWESLKRAFPNSKNGSRVIITTCKEDVAERADDKEDQVLEADNLIRLWMAEGFIIPRGEERMKDVAEGFLNELIRRSLVQVAKTLWEKVTDCRVHDLLRDLAIQKALEVNFFDFYEPRKHSISCLCIRHVIHSQGERYLSLDLSNLKLRSIMFSDPDFRNMSLMNFSSVFQHLYVLYLDMRVVSIIPDAIGSLYHLKLLRLRGIRVVPSSIGNLKNLQTLVVNEGGYSCELPHETADLINLRHLVASYSKPLKRISKLTSLEVLKGVHCDQWKGVDPVDLVNLLELSMDQITKSYSLNNISSLKNLSSLTLWMNHSHPLNFLVLVKSSRNCC
ncbi:hypothetical protein KY289_019722 [Solanum tuberosum]|nr:hypothetical protein KY289_019722 [Solanum tuberosum]